MLSSGISLLNPKAECTRATQSLAINVNAAKGLMEILRTSLGPMGTYKMLVSGSGDIKVTKDGNVLLGEMQIQHPTASLIARAATAQETVTGDGTTSIVLLIGELLKQADLYIAEGLHPRVLHSGLHFVKPKVMEILDKLSIKLESPVSRDTLLKVARTALRTKVPTDLADHLTDIIVDAVSIVSRNQTNFDLKMIEIMEMMHQSEAETRLVKGLVLDHGGRHPEMPRRLRNAYVLTCNVSMEFEKTEINAGFFYKSAEDREKLVASERQFILNRVQKVVDLKKKLCTASNNKSFLVVNQKGIDPFSLDLFARNGILALRRAKRRNMERLTLACGGIALNSFDELDEKCLGFAGEVYEHILGEDKYTFIEGCKDPRSATILIKGPNKHTMNQIKDAVRDGLKATANAIEDGRVVPGAGAFEVACSQELLQFKAVTKGRARLAVQALADALLIIPKAIASNAGLDVQEVIVKLQDEYDRTKIPVGVDLNTGLPINPLDLGILDCYRVKRNIIYSSITIASSILLVDEILRAGVSLKNTKATPS